MEKEVFLKDLRSLSAFQRLPHLRKISIGTPGSFEKIHVTGLNIDFLRNILRKNKKFQFVFHNLLVTGDRFLDEIFNPQEVKRLEWGQLDAYSRSCFIHPLKAIYSPGLNPFNLQIESALSWNQVLNRPLPPWCAATSFKKIRELSLSVDTTPQKSKLFPCCKKSNQSSPSPEFPLNELVKNSSKNPFPNLQELNLSLKVSLGKDQTIKIDNDAVKAFFKKIPAITSFKFNIDLGTLRKVSKNFDFKGLKALKTEALKKLTLNADLFLDNESLRLFIQTLPSLEEIRLNIWYPNTKSEAGQIIGYSKKLLSKISSLKMSSPLERINLFIEEGDKYFYANAQNLLKNFPGSLNSSKVRLSYPPMHPALRSFYGIEN